MITRTTSLSRPYILTRLFKKFPEINSSNSIGNLEFFNIGLPGKNPISPVGTILIIFNDSFLYNNMEFFSWGCMGDNGGIKNGFNPYIGKEYYKEVRLNFEQISKIQLIIKSLPLLEKEKVLNNEISKIFIENLKSILPPIVLRSISENLTESSRKIEFCLKGKLNIANEDIYKIIIPNTYKKLLPRKNAYFSKEKIHYYNPKRHPLLEI